jgi:hypothetical protein
MGAGCLSFTRRAGDGARLGIENTPSVGAGEPVLAHRFVIKEHFRLREIRLPLYHATY